MRHLSNIGLYEAVFGEPSARPASVVAHLEQCDRCADASAAIQELGFLFKRMSPSGSGDGGCFSTDEIADYLEGDPADKSAIKEHLDVCDSCFDSAAYYFAESSRMKTFCDSTAAGVERAAFFQRQKTGSRHGQGWADRFGGWLVPFPAFATAAVLLIALVSSQPEPIVDVLKGSPTFSVYQKRPDSLPYFYFGGEGKKIGSLPADMSVTSQRGRVTFDWTPVKGEKSGYFFLQETVDGSPSKIREIKDAVPPLSMSSASFKPGAVYRWVTAGSLGDDKYFEGMLEFKVSE